MRLESCQRLKTVTLMARAFSPLGRMPAIISMRSSICTGAVGQLQCACGYIVRSLQTGTHPAANSLYILQSGWSSDTVMLAERGIGQTHS